MHRKYLTIAIKAAIEASRAIMKIYNDPDSDFEIERKSDNSPLTKADKVSHSIIYEALATTNIPILSEEGRNIDYSVRKNWSQLWIVDPIDGTKEFIRKNGEFTVNIALVEESTPILGVILTPATGQLYYGSVGEGAYRIKIDINNTIDLESLFADAVQMPIDNNESGSYRVVASRSHLNDQTAAFIEGLKQKHSVVDLVSKGSSLKICLVAEGSADIYPRFAPTMEWDTAAGDAIMRSLAMPMALYDVETRNKLTYNKQNLLNPYFITTDEF